MAFDVNPFSSLKLIYGNNTFLVIVACKIPIEINKNLEKNKLNNPSLGFITSEFVI